MTQRLTQYLHRSVRASWLAIASVAALSALTPHTSSAQSAKTNLNDLVISGAKIIHRKTKAIVLDADNLARTIEGAGKYFDVTKGEFKTCGEYLSNHRPFQHQLSLNGAVVACAFVSDHPRRGPYSLVIVGPVRDLNGGYPSAQLVELGNFKPLRDCDEVEGIMTCIPKIPSKNKMRRPQHFYTMDGGCNGTQHVKAGGFAQQKGNFKVCAFVIFGKDPQG